MEADPVGGTPAAWPVLRPRQAALIAAVWTLALLLFSVFAHTTPYFRAETDLVGEYLPAARELAQGVLDPARYAFKGPGYPLLVAGVATVLQGDVALAARIIAPVSTGLAAWLVFILAGSVAGGAIATFAFVAFLTLPEVMRYAIEAGTDAPALALMLGATLLTLGSRGWRGLAVAGGWTGLAILTRSNAASLCLAALPLIALRPGRLRALSAYALGLALPLLAWQWAGYRAGGLPPDRNYLNVAWELYGRGVPPAEFERTTGAHFHSMLDVLRFAPLQALGTVARNLFAHRALDLQQLVPVWLGVLALPGVLLLARDRRARGWLWHAAACALVLAPVFYSARFALYLAPVYAAAAGASLLWLAAQTTARWGARAGRLVPALAAAVLVANGGVAGHGSYRALVESPHEVRLGGEALAHAGLSGQRILARKPHVAWYSGLSFVPLPGNIALAELPTWATAQGVNYLFFSPIERIQRPLYGVLSDSALRLPGFTQILWRRLAPDHFYAVYRLDAIAPDTAAFRLAYRSALRRHEAVHADELGEQVFLACEWLTAGEPLEALVRLDAVVRAGGDRGEVHRLRSDAFVALERWGEAEAACRAAMRVEPAYGWHWARLGRAAWHQGRLDEAHEHVAKALVTEPASLEYLEMSARIDVNRKQPALAAATLERALQLVPKDIRLRQMAIDAWSLAGQPTNAERLFDEGLAVGIAPAALSGRGDAVR